MSYLKMVKTFNATVLNLKSMRERNELLRSNAVNDLRRARKAALKEAGRLLSEKEAVYRRLLKKNFHISNPAKARAMEQTIIFQRARHQALVEGKSRNDYDMKTLIENLAMTSDPYD